MFFLLLILEEYLGELKVKSGGNKELFCYLNVLFDVHTPNAHRNLTPNITAWQPVLKVPK